jgi:hydroxymethylbilane synthase
MSVARAEGPGRPGPAIRLATRGSPLARWQAARVAGLLDAAAGAPVCQILVIDTTGDRLAEVPIEQIGGQGVFVKEIQAAVLEGRADVAVHSAKDLPSITPAGLVLAAIPERVDPRDAVVGSRLADLGVGATVATGSVRRRAQLAWLRPDLTFVELRGNMATRLERARAAGAGLVAVAALERLGLRDQIAEILDTVTCLPQVAQGALAVECRVDDADTRRALAAIDDPVAHAAVTAERAFLAEMGGGCTLPVGALATPCGFDLPPTDRSVSTDRSAIGGRPARADRLLEDNDPATTGHPTATGNRAAPGATGDPATTGDPAISDRPGTAADRPTLVLDGLLAGRDGRILLRRRLSGDDPTDLGRRLAVDLLDHGGRVLDDWDLVGPSGR